MVVLLELLNSKDLQAMPVAGSTEGSVWDTKVQQPYYYRKDVASQSHLAFPRSSTDVGDVSDVSPGCSPGCSDSDLRVAMTSMWSASPICAVADVHPTTNNICYNRNSPIVANGFGYNAYSCQYGHPFHKQPTVDSGLGTSNSTLRHFPLRCHSEPNVCFDSISTLLPKCDTGTTLKASEFEMLKCAGGKPEAENEWEQKFRQVTFNIAQGCTNQKDGNKENHSSWTDRPLRVKQNKTSASFTSAKHDNAVQLDDTEFTEAIYV